MKVTEHIKSIADNITNPNAEDYEDNNPNGFDYLEDVLDVKWVIDNNGHYVGAELLVAFGGPNIWIHTRNNQIKGYWWGDNDVAEYEDNLGLDEACEEWFNSTNGGGQNARGFGTLDGMIKTYSKAKSTLKTIEGIIDKLGLKERKSGLQNIKATLQNIQNEMNKTNKDLFPINFFNKNTLTNLIDLSNEKHNCRVKPFVVEYWTVYRDDFDIDPNPAKWEFIVVLLDENGNPLSCASGSNRSKGNIESKKGIGLFGIEIEYDVWKDWPPHIHIRFGSKFNPNEKKRRAAQSIPEAVKDVVAFCKGEKLFKEVIDPDTKKKEKILDIHHKVNRDYLKNEQGFKSNEIDKICTFSKSLFGIVFSH